MTGRSKRSDATRERLLSAALEVFAGGGTRAATSRRIADKAGVNEVTLFRHFRSKEQLLDAALRRVHEDGVVPPLPAEPHAPRTELLHWCTRVLEDLRGRAAVTRTCLAEAVDRPELAGYVGGAPRRALAELSRYLNAVRERGLSGREVEPGGVAAQLVAAMFCDAVSRDVVPEVFPARRQAPAFYVDTLLAALSVRSAAPSGARAAPPPSLPDATGG